MRATILVFALVLQVSIFSIADAYFGTSDEAKSKNANRVYTECKCVQKIRTNYVFGNLCGQAALCYWEIWNYLTLKSTAKKENYDEECDKYQVQKYACLIGYPKPQTPDEQCVSAIKTCNDKLSKILYKDCDQIRKSRNLRKPQEVDTTLTLPGLNYGLSQDEYHKFVPIPSSKAPKRNNYYALSCPIIYHFPFFTIAMLLEELDSEIEYDETDAIEGVAQFLPRFLRDGINNERIQNFDALALDPNMIHWCGIPRNYICIREELDKKGSVCADLVKPDACTD